MKEAYFLLFIFSIKIEIKCLKKDEGQSAMPKKERKNVKCFSSQKKLQQKLVKVKMELLFVAVSSAFLLNFQ